MKNLLWYLIAGTKGGETRGRIISFIMTEPSNANKLSEALNLDYKTIRHHLEVLEKNDILKPENKGNYGAVYFLSESLEKNIKLFEEIWAKFGKK
ncbi:MAG TPA: winged helix-turn-helix domain-containing protein [Candidatus Nanoarchaeia archaeon]|nr:winged helix-turn-helix domain-containing protein [Candidatus Nanoarchaeia archaeon]